MENTNNKEKRKKINAFVNIDEQEKAEALKKKQYRYLSSRRKQFTWVMSFGISIIVISLLLINKMSFWWALSSFGFVIMAVPLLAVIKYDRRLKITREVIKEYRSML